MFLPYFLSPSTLCDSLMTKAVLPTTVYPAFNTIPILLAYPDMELHSIKIYWMYNYLNIQVEETTNSSLKVSQIVMKLEGWFYVYICVYLYPHALQILDYQHLDVLSLLRIQKKTLTCTRNFNYTMEIKVSALGRSCKMFSIIYMLKKKRKEKESHQNPLGIAFKTLIKLLCSLQS